MGWEVLFGTSVASPPFEPGNAGAPPTAVGVLKVAEGEEPYSELASCSKSSSLNAVTEKSVPDPISGGWLTVRAQSAPIAERCDDPA